MILVDSGVWIDLFTDRMTEQTLMLRRLIADRRQIGVGDLVLVEVLQGTRDDRAFNRMRGQLSLFDTIRISDAASAIRAASHYRILRSKGITIRKTIDTLIATRCILDSIPLLYSDRDFDPFVQHLGLRSAMDIDTGVP